jgi:hypothetical protein
VRLYNRADNGWRQRNTLQISASKDENIPLCLPVSVLSKNGLYSFILIT